MWLSCHLLVGRILACLPKVQVEVVPFGSELGVPNDGRRYRQCINQVAMQFQAYSFSNARHCDEIGKLEAQVKARLLDKSE